MDRGAMTGTKDQRQGRNKGGGRKEKRKGQKSLDRRE